MRRGPAATRPSPLTVSAPSALVAGGGVAGLETMLALRALAEERVDIELLAVESLFWYRPLAVAEPFGLGEADNFELAWIARACGARFSLGELTEVVTERASPGPAAGSRCLTTRSC